MDETKLLRKYPWAYHVASREGLEAIESHGLLSASSLLDLFEVPAERRSTIEGHRRENPIRLDHATRGIAVIRDHGPISERKLGGLLDNMTPAEWYRELDRYVFFWLEPKRVLSLLAAYAEVERVVVVVPTGELIERWRDRIRLAAINTGDTHAMARRGRSTFSTIEDYARGDVAELCVVDSVPDLRDYVERVDLVPAAATWTPRPTRIAVLGWGSLIWNPDTLDCAGRWERGGPTLKLEFSRISGGNRLTLVVDPDHGRDCETYYVLSGRRTIAEAIENLRTREDMPFTRRIGVARAFGAVKAVDEATGRTMRTWTREKGFDATIWTDLEPNFPKFGLAYSAPEAERWLKSLEPAQRAEAHRYIANAPPTVRTDFTDLLDLNGPC